MPSSFAIARPVNPRRPESRYVIAPSLTPRGFARAKPSLIPLACELPDCVERVKNHFTRHLGSINARAWNDQGDFVRGKVSKHPHELIKTAAKSTFKFEASTISTLPAQTSRMSAPKSETT
jgi:hypothetical protein